jgi:hypothetical protein
MLFTAANPHALRAEAAIKCNDNVYLNVQMVGNAFGSLAFKNN